MKRGDLVEVAWRDAHYTTDIDEAFSAKAERGGELLYAVGYVCAIFKKSIVVAAELDEERNPSRDFTCIPRPLIESVKVLRKHSFTK